MSLYLLRPNYQHRAANVLSSTSEAGLTVGEPTPASGNDGTLRLRCSGTPTAAEAIDVKLETSGAPYGYAAEADTTEASGVAVSWRRTGEASTAYRGYVDTPALVRVAHPIAWVSGHGIPSSAKVLADGRLGLIMATVAGTETVKFYRIASNWSVSESTIATGQAAGSVRHDFAVLPSGRLVAMINLYYLYYSDDHGATWATLGIAPNTNIASLNVTCLEAAGEDVVLVAASKTGAVSAWIGHSRDGGATWTVQDTGVSLNNPRTTQRAGTVHVCDKQGVAVFGYTIEPGGALSTGITTDAGCNVTTIANSAMLCRDDGVLWSFGWQASAAGGMNADMGVSTDGGVTWRDNGGEPFTSGATGYATDGIGAFSAASWNGLGVIVAQADSSTGTDGGLHFLCLGEWSTYAEPCSGTIVSGTPYRKGYIPFDYPNALGWTRTSTGAGGTITNQPHLRVVTTGGNGERYTAPAAVWSPAAADHVMVKLRTRVNSGGSLTASEVYAEVGIDDGVNTQKIRLRLTTTGARVIDGTGAQLGTDLTATLTGWTDWIIDFWHDNPAGSGKLSVYYQQDGGAGIYLPWITSATINEQAGVATEALQWAVSEGASVDLGCMLVGTLGLTTAPIRGRPLSSLYDVALVSGINLGAYGTGGVSGDTYALATRYTYGKEKVWSELRPSCRTESAADGVTWSVTFDAGATDLFRGDMLAAFGTNMRTARWQMNATDSWATPTVDAPLDATLTSFTVGAGGFGYVGPTASPNWRPGQWRSNGDSRRYFVMVGSTAYEITDNDEDRLYVDSVDLSGASGTAYIFGDRMAATFTFGQYRFARFAVTSAQDTADGAYRLGTPIVGKKWSPDQLYDFGFVDRVTPNVTTTEAENGAVATYRRGPALDSLDIQWPPLDRLVTDVELRLRDFYRAIDGSLTPVVLWRASTDQGTLSMVQVREVYSASNVLGELDNAVTRVDQLMLREVW